MDHVWKSISMFWEGENQKLFIFTIWRGGGEGLDKKGFIYSPRKTWVKFFIF